MRSVIEQVEEQSKEHFNGNDGAAILRDMQVMRDEKAQ